ncbi:MAG: xylan 1,4-beta-xylosidase [Actinomycetota bacterium]|nr:xylan 1,4-beta-xylosidase [Actinomycetota bacterium]
MTALESTNDAHQDWTNRIGDRSDSQQSGPRPKLPAPGGVRAIAGRGQVSVHWDPVDDAIGYLVHRSDSRDGPFVPIDHDGQDVLSVPLGGYADTTTGSGPCAWYAVAAMLDVDTAGELSDPVAPEPVATPGQVRIRVDRRVVGELARPWRPMIGSEHLSHLLCADTSGGQPIGDELAAALGLMATELGVTHVRAHGILCDDLGVYREVDGVAVHDFSGVDRVYDTVLRLGLRPVVELGFMPRDLASDPTATVFTYGAITSPPKDYRRWAGLITALTAHLVDRYGLDEVRGWGFEVWNEPNLTVFWAADGAEYFRLYDVTARAVKAVDDRLQVGGPASAASNWIDQLLDHVAESGAPIDFVSTHVYGNAPLDFRPTLARYGRSELTIQWTEWGPTPTHFKRVGDGVLGAGFLLRGMKSAAGRIDALSHWVASDHFEELGRPLALAHGGFGLLSVGNLRKPRYWALQLAEQLGDNQRAIEVKGDGAVTMVEVLAAEGTDGAVSALIWNSTLDQSKVAGSDELARHITIDMEVPGGEYQLSQLRVDAQHSSIIDVWNGMSDDAAWPTDAQWAELRARNVLEPAAPTRTVVASDGVVSVQLELPMPGIASIVLTPL